MATTTPLDATKRSKGSGSRKVEPITLSPTEIAGIPTELLAPMRNGSVREYDRPFFTNIEGVGRSQNPDARRVWVHPPGSEVAEALRPIVAERNKPRAATRVDANQHEEIALLEECGAHEAAKQGLTERAERHATQAKRRRRAWMIRRHLNAQHRPSTPIAELRPAHAAPRARARRDRRTSSPSRAGPDDDGEPSEPPPDGRRCECGCDLALTGLRADARYLNDAHRKRAQRARDRLQPERVPERRLVLLAEAGDLLPPVRCKCDPKRHLVDEGVCVQCGRARGVAAVAWLSDARDLRSKQLVARSPARRRPRYGNRKRKPVRKFVDKTIVRRVAA